MGRILAEKLGWPFVDLDKEVEKSIGMTIAGYFTQAGEAAFRDREQETVVKVAALTQVVLATGGGVVLRQGNIDRLRETGVLVCLSASEHEIVARTSGDVLRPLLNRPDRLQAIRELLATRLPLYRQSDIWVETGGRSAEEIAAGILRRLQEEGWLHGDHSGEPRSGKL